MQAVAADHDLVAVGQGAPFDSLAVDEHAVEAAVVEDAEPVGLAHDQRMAPGYRGVVEADVSGQAAPDPGPFAPEPERDHALIGLAVGEVLAGLVEAVAQLIEPALILELRNHFDDRSLRCREQRCSDELSTAATGAFRQ